MANTEAPKFTLVTGGYQATCEPSPRTPYPCSPNTGFCEPRIMCRPQTEGAPCNPAGRVIRIPNCSPEFSQPCSPRSGPGGPCMPGSGPSFPFG